MNETLQNAVAELLKKTLSSVESAGAFLASETPEYVNQLMNWHFISSLALFILFILLSIALVVAGVYFSKFAMSLEKDKEEVLALTIVVPLFSFVLCVVGILNNLAWLQIMIAPKVWLVSYITGLIK